ncbi:hypothetical protein P7C70_g2435, partial [Phenoliferia sp. Uapishka_3]
MAGNLSHSMRTVFISDYENLEGTVWQTITHWCRNHVLSEFMDRYVDHEPLKILRVLDLAAGSGEATEALLDWKSSRWPSKATDAVPTAGSNHPPPTGRQFPNRAFKPARVREKTASRSEPDLSITASDPFTSPGYIARTGLPCLELSFADVAAGKLPSPPQPPALLKSESQAESESGSPDVPPQEVLYDIVVISFALHLVESTSELWALLTELSKRAKWLVVTAPHKKPEIKPSWGWRRWDPTTWTPSQGRGNVGGIEGDGFEIVLDRVRLRVWRSQEHWVEE